MDGIFDSLTTKNDPSLVSETHYKIVEERRRKWKTGETKARSWEIVKLELKQKHGF